MAAKRTIFLAFLAGVILASSLPCGPLSADNREDRVRKFQTSLGEEVVRDSRGELPGTEKRSVLFRSVVAVAVVIVLLAGVSLAVSRIRANRSEREIAVQYLTEHLMTPEAVRDHLQRVTSARTPLYLWIGDHFIKFSSRADDLTAGGGTFSILPVTPASGNEMLRGSQRVRVEYLHQKVPYHFTTAWSEERGDQGSFVHLLSVPKRIQFTQRRDHYRVDPSLDTPVTFRAVDRDLPSMGVLDIGMGGFAVATSTRLRPGEEIHPCRIEGEDLLPIDCSARCAYEFPLPENTSKYRYRYGFTITRFAEGNGKRLSRFIAQRQLADLSRRKAMES